MSGEIRPLAARPSAQAPAAPAPGAADGELHKAAVAFEGMLISLMFQNMRKTVQQSGLLGDTGQARGTLQYLLDQAVVDSAMKGGRTWGLAGRIEEAWRAKAAPSQSGHPKSVQAVEVPDR